MKTRELDMKKNKGWMKICTIAMSIVMIVFGGVGSGLWITYGGGAFPD